PSSRRWATSTLETTSIPTPSAPCSARDTASSRAGRATPSARSRAGRMRAPASVPAAGASRTPPLQVFISYSHEPPENAEFVRELADQLRRVNLRVWLDEERVSAGQEL